jgi:hypothetical protein
MVEMETATLVLERPVKGLGRQQRAVRPSAAQRAWLRQGLNEAGGKLPLFDRQGQAYNRRTIRACIAQGWAEPWIENPIKPDWLVCKLTPAGRAAVS